MKRFILAALSLILIPLSAFANADQAMDAAAIDEKVRRIDDSIAAISRIPAGSANAAAEQVIRASLGHGIAPDAPAKTLVPLYLRKIVGHEEYIREIESELALVNKTQESMPAHIQAMGEDYIAALQAKKTLNKAHIALSRQSLIYLTSELGGPTVLEKQVDVLKKHKALLLLEKKLL